MRAITHELYLRSLFALLLAAPGHLLKLDFPSFRPVGPGPSPCRHAVNWCSKTRTPQWPGAQMALTPCFRCSSFECRWPWCWPSVMPKSRGAASPCSRSEAQSLPSVPMGFFGGAGAQLLCASRRCKMCLTEFQWRPDKAIGDDVLLRHAYWPNPHLMPKPGFWPT